MQPSQNTVNGLRPRFSASYKDSDTIEKKSVPRRLRNVRTEVRNVERTHRFIVAPTKETIATLQGSEKSSSQGLQKKTSLSMARRITIRISRNSISCRQKLPIKNPIIKI